MEKSEILGLVIIGIVFCTYLIWIIRKKQIKEVAIKLIVEAEKNLQNGDEKMNYCIEKIAALVPLPFSLFITTNMVRKIIQEVFDRIKIALDYQKPISFNEVEKIASEQIICEPETDIDRKEGTE